MMAQASAEENAKRQPFTPDYRALPPEIFDPDRVVTLACYRFWYGLVQCPKTGDPVFVTLWSGAVDTGYYWIPPSPRNDPANQWRQAAVTKEQPSVKAWLSGVLGDAAESVRVPKSPGEHRSLLQDGVPYLA